MKRSDEDKQLAKVALNRTAHEQDPTVKAGWKNLAEMYFRQAGQSEERISTKLKDDPVLD